MKITLNRINDDFLFECKNKNGHSLLLDNTSRNDAKGVSPMEALLMSMVSCSSIDIVAILKKQRQTITDFSAEVEGLRRETEGGAKPFKSINVVFSLKGEIDSNKAKRAADLSFTKYCSVSKSLDPTIEINYQVIVNDQHV